MRQEIQRIHIYVEKYINNTFTNSINSYFISLGEKILFDSSTIKKEESIDDVSRYRFKTNGYIYVTDLSGTIISHPSKSRIGTKSVVSNWIRSSGLTPSFRKYNYDGDDKYLYKIYSKEHKMFFILSCYVSDFSSLVNLGDLKNYVNDITRDLKLNVIILNESNRALLHPTVPFGSVVKPPEHTSIDRDGYFTIVNKINEINGFYSKDNFFNWIIAVSGTKRELQSRRVVLKKMIYKLIPMLTLFILSISIIFLKLISGLRIQEKNLEMIYTQKELLYKLGETVETRSKETSTHVKRVSFISEFIAKKYGLRSREQMILKSAAPLHDIGKIGISDSILHKPGKLTPLEYEAMKKHTTVGYNILKGSEKPLLKASATIANEHHEHWDGNGYPNGKCGNDIHIYARIVNIADVIDALLSKRSYKDPWPADKVFKYIEEEKGKMFEPQLVNIVLKNREKILDIITGIKETKELYSY